MLKSQRKIDREREEAKKLHYSEMSVDDDNKVSQARLQNENLFFFTDQEYFESNRYEYIGQKEPSKGFVFGLFNPQQNFFSQGKDITPASVLSDFNNN